MRERIVIGNWKMNTTIDEAINLMIDLKEGLGENFTAVCVPFTHLGIVQEIADDRIAVGAQNVCQFSNGAYTGEISAAMLQSLGLEYVIIGHSERRKLFNESDAKVNAKIRIALQHDISPIICCGESQELRKAGNYLPFIKDQILKAFDGVSKDEIGTCLIAYEPIWAIGTGETASASQAQEVHAFIRKELENMYDATTANQISILYGGSVSSKNAKELFEEKDVDGALVGGASLEAKDFIKIINAL
jgi:triosephosphate isomerase (TIM)